MEGIDDAADDALGPQLLDVGRHGEGGLKVFTDGDDHRIAVCHGYFLEHLDVRAVGGDEVLDLVLHVIGVFRIAVHADDFVAVSHQLPGEVGAETAKSDDAEAHDEWGGRLRSDEKDVFLGVGVEGFASQRHEGGGKREQAETTDEHVEHNDQLGPRCELRR